MARNQIKGITIEIGGDTTKLQTALKGVESKIKNTQAALRDVQKLLKLDPGNVELLRQKQQLLNDAYEASKDKLKTLKDAAKQAADAAADGNEDAKAKYDALQREIIETEQEMKKLSKEMKNFGSVAAQQVKAAGEKIKALGDKMQKVGTAMTKYVTGPIAAVGAASVAAFREVDEGLDIIVKKTGATGDALKEMEDSAKNLATSIPTDFTTAGNAVAEVNTRFGLTGKALEDLSGKFIKFASLNDTDVTTSIDSVQAAMAAFSIDAANAGYVLDILNKTGQDTGKSVDQLASELSSNAAQLRQMGFNIGQSAKFLGALEKQGVDASAAITGMRKAMQTAIKSGKTLAQAVSEYETKIKSAKNSTQAMAIATELFGSKAGPALGAALYEGRMSLTDISASMEEFAGSVDRTFEETQDPLDDFKTTLNELKIVGAEVVSAAAPMIKQFAQGVKSAVESIRGWWESLSPMAQETIIKAAEIAAAVGPIILVVGKLTSAVGSILTLGPNIVSMIGTVKAGATALWGVLAANPITAVIAGVTALGAGLVVLYNKCEWFRNAVNTLWEGIKHIVSSIGDAIMNVIHSIKLPHFKIEGSFSLVPPRVPHLAVEWYKKAMDNGMILNSPTIFGAANGRLLGGGDAGPEAVVGVDSLRNMIQSAVSQSGGKTPRNMTVILQLDKTELGRTVYQLNNAEAQRVGVRLATV